MQFRVFQVPAADDGTCIADLNLFLRQVRVLMVDRRFVETPTPTWLFCVEYLAVTTPAARASGNRASDEPKVDWREVLAPADFELYSALRSLRKLLSEQQGVPVYALFTNRQLASIAQARPDSATALKTIDGIGEAKCNQFGDKILAVVKGSPSPPSTSARA